MESNLTIAYFSNGLKAPTIEIVQLKIKRLEETRMSQKEMCFYMCQGLNSYYFHIIGDGHQPNSRGLYTHYKDS